MSRSTLSLLCLAALACAAPGAEGRRGGPVHRSEASRVYDARFPDPGSPLDRRDLSSSERSGAVLVELTYAGDPGTGPVRATLVRPGGEGKPGPGILWVHWLGEPATSNRTEFLEEAVALAQAGATSLLVDALWSTPKWYERRAIDRDPDDLSAQVVSLRRGLDLLALERTVDPDRLGLVGHDFGGMTGILAGAADGRPRSYVLLAMAPRFQDWMFYDPAKHPTDEAGYRGRLGALDPVDALPALEGAALIQLAEKDFYVPSGLIDEWRRAVGGRGEVRVYPTSHAMELAPVRKDREDWLRRTLGLASAPQSELPARAKE